MDPRRPEIRGEMAGPCSLTAALLSAVVVFSGAIYAAGLIALTNLIGGV